MKIIHLVLLVVCSAITWVAQAQEILGLWEIKNVSVGEEAMNPVAKWTRINPDGTYQSGNGWLQNSSGTWTFNEISMEFLPVEDFGIKEDFGAFIVSFSGGKMLWERHEKGMTVLVILEKIQQLPKSTADWITGLWDLTEAIQSGKTLLPLWTRTMITSFLFAGTEFMWKIHRRATVPQDIGISIAIARKSLL